MKQALTFALKVLVSLFVVVVSGAILLFGFDQMITTGNVSGMIFAIAFVVYLVLSVYFNFLGDSK